MRRRNCSPISWPWKWRIIYRFVGPEFVFVSDKISQTEISWSVLARILIEIVEVRSSSREGSRILERIGKGLNEIVRIFGSLSYYICDMLWLLYYFSSWHSVNLHIVLERKKNIFSSQILFVLRAVENSAILIIVVCDFEMAGPLVVFLHVYSWILNHGEEV